MSSYMVVVPSEVRTLLGLGRDSMASGHISCVYLKFRSYCNSGYLAYLITFTTGMQGLQVYSSAGRHSPC